MAPTGIWKTRCGRFLHVQPQAEAVEWNSPSPEALERLAAMVEPRCGHQGAAVRQRDDVCAVPVVAVEVISRALELGVEPALNTR